MPPFMHRHCPCCSACTWQHYLLRDGELRDADGELQAVCESCETVLIYRADGSVGQRAATAEEREVLPPKVVWSHEQRAEWQASLRQGKTDLRAWIQAGCPGLTPEIERDLPPGAMDRLKRFVGLPDDDEGAPKRHAQGKQRGQVNPRAARDPPTARERDSS
jgi:hypothetical protein